ncbi:hypothetical protein RND71_021600 [Anisodus tanguticus]|uniref:Transcription factor MYC/MYB N-terminal domain-containing protein n=1 Tax=Anisodus tanguticus TaxID=243964 RepID=A0AAE1RWU2_9SOLA|nr:hypothetical protein RND71_021600 [Anisodus tanguticus]
MERALEWLRPLVDSKNWEYCVVWKLGDDPSRVDANVKTQQNSLLCVEIAKFSTLLEQRLELKGTLVLIPVAGGLVELYNSKLVTIISLLGFKYIKIKRRLISLSIASNFVQKKPNSSTSKKEDQVLDSFPYEKLSFYAPPLQYTTSFTSSAPHISQVSSTGSIPSNELTLCHSPSDHRSLNVPLSQSTEGYFVCNGNLSRIEVYFFALEKRKSYNCRRYLCNGWTRLQYLEMQLTIDYINELQEKVKLFQAELNEIESDVTNNDIEADFTNDKTAEVVLSDMREMSKVTEPTNEKTQISTNTTERTRMEGQVDVNQIGAREFLLKVSGSHKPGGFTQLMEVMNYIGLELVNVSFTTSGGKILSIFIAEGLDIYFMIDLQAIKLYFMFYSIGSSHGEIHVSHGMLIYLLLAASVDRVLDAQKLRSSVIELTS